MYNLSGSNPDISNKELWNNVESKLDNMDQKLDDLAVKIDEQTGQIQEMIDQSTGNKMHNIRWISNRPFLSLYLF